MESRICFRHAKVGNIGQIFDTHQLRIQVEAEASKPSVRTTEVLQRTVEIREWAETHRHWTRLPTSLDVVEEGLNLC